MKNMVGREIPEYIEGYGQVKPFSGAFAGDNQVFLKSVSVNPVKPGESKLLKDIDEALEKVSLRDGQTISFHHHLRNGDYVLNMVLERIAAKGIRDIKVAASSIFPIHKDLVEHIRNGVVSGIFTNYISGPVARGISRGILKQPIVMMTHGGRARAIECGDLKIDVAFIAAPCADKYGNINGVQGKSACGSLGYAIEDARYADKVVAVTDYLVDYPARPIEISQQYVDFVVAVDSIGDPSGIASGTTRITKDPVGLIIAKTAAKVLEVSGYVNQGMSFQTGAGGTSLAVAAELKKIMQKKKVTGSFAAGGITGYIVEMLREGLFNSLLDVQCFDLEAVSSYRDDPRHQGMSASMYANPHNKGCVVNNLDVMILGATEIDLDFNVNVTTGSDGVLMGGSGGHSDTAAGSKIAIVVTNLIKSRLPIIKERVTTVTTPGESIDVLVTERGIAVNPGREDLKDKLAAAGLPVYSMVQLLDLAYSITGKPKPVKFEEDIVALVQYRDGTIIDVVRKTAG